MKTTIAIFFAVTMIACGESKADRAKRVSDSIEKENAILQRKGDSIGKVYDNKIKLIEARK